MGASSLIINRVTSSSATAGASATLRQIGHSSPRIHRSHLSGSRQVLKQSPRTFPSGPNFRGDALPSIRQLANDLELNSKTVAKAYKLLERDSIIEAKGYRGTYVHPKAKSNCKFNLQEWTQRKLEEAIAELREAGVTDSEIRNAFAGVISRQPPAK